MKLKGFNWKVRLMEAMEVVWKNFWLHDETHICFQPSDLCEDPSQINQLLKNEVSSHSSSMSVLIIISYEALISEVNLLTVAKLANLIQ